MEFEVFQFKPDFLGKTPGSEAFQDIEVVDTTFSDSSSVLRDAPSWPSVFALLLHRLTAQNRGSFVWRREGRSGQLVTLAVEAPVDFEGWASLVQVKDLSDVSPPGSVPIVLATSIQESPAEIQVVVGAPLVRARFRSDLFDPERIREFLTQLVLLGGQVLADPKKNIGDYSLVTAPALAVLPDPRAVLDPTPTVPVPTHILSMAETQPDSIAIEQGPQSWTYRQLAEAALAVASSLRAGGLVTGERVALTGPRSFGFFAAMVGILRSGGVLVNIDPAMPDQRQAMMAQVAQVSRLVCVRSEGLGPSTLAKGLVQVVELSPEGRIEAALSPGEAAGWEPPLPGDQAYIFFTSGSTGNPKAVLGRHAGLSHFLQWQRTRFEIGPHDRASQLTALSFDVILRDSLMILTSGGTLCIPGEYDVLEPARIISWLRMKQVTVLHVVPSLAKLWVKSMPLETEALGLEHVFFAGEPLTDTLVQDCRVWFAPRAQIVNLYGPTETTLAKCFFPIGDLPEKGVQPIGQPLPQTQVLILNKNRHLCGLNEPGEIVIRTPFRTLGYFNNPEANAKAFFPNPFTGDPEDLLYLTGDGGSYRQDGSLAIHGRLDNQVKIRGIRVEPGEIEGLLSTHPSVKDNAVVARLDFQGEKALVAYVVPKGEPEPTWTFSLREFLKERVPSALVPSAFVVQAVLPLNPNGKVDRKALPDPSEADFASSVFAGATNPIEEKLIAVWVEVLGRSRVGIDDDFFDLGGHSLLAVKMIQQVRSLHGLHLSIPMVFRSRTIRKLAAELSVDDPNVAESMVLALQPKGSGPALFCLVGLHLYQELADQLAPEIPVNAIYLSFEEKLLEADSTGGAVLSIGELAASYVEAIRAAQPTGPYLVCGVSFGGLIAYEVGCQLEQSGQTVGFVGLLDCWPDTALKRNWPLWVAYRVKSLFRKGGWQSAATKVLGKFQKGKEQVGPPVSTPSDPMEDLDARRHHFYQLAQRVYRARATSNPVVLVKALIPMHEKYDLGDPTFGWGEVASRLTILESPGDHLGILSGPNAPILAKKLAPFLLSGRNAGVKAE